MPLYKSIPLCSFNYTGDTLSSATFNYDTTSKIFMKKNKLLYKESVCQINKNCKNRYMYDEVQSVEKIDEIKYMYSEMKTINQESNNYLYGELRSINKRDTHCLGGEIKRIFKRSNRELNRGDIDILNEHSKELDASMVNINLNHSIELGQANMSQGINKINELNLEIPLREISKEYDMNLGKSSIIETNKVSYIELSNQRSTEINTDYGEKNIISLNLKDIYVYNMSNYYKRIYSKEVFKNNNKYMDIITYVPMYKDDSNSSLIRVIDSTPIFKAENESYYLKDITIMDIDLPNYCKLFYRENTRLLSKNNIYTRLLKRLKLVNIYKPNHNFHFYRLAIFNIDNYDTLHYLKPISIKEIIEVDNLWAFNRIAITPVFKLEEHYLKREAITNTFRINNKYLKPLPLIPIYKQEEKSILDITINPIYKEVSKYLKDLFVTPIYKDSLAKSIEVVKRWWWLKDTSLRDKLIVPNRDYSKMIDLLNNSNFEYLRYNDHPIEWGKTWGIDWSIPTYGVSVEVMLDLINILIMVWHHDTQAWLNCTGKEGIQFVMELLYDWYSMDTSKPNTSYKRAYRWIRWEAEKVYFLNTNSGLQSIGILIANLLDYMKFHHFNIIPLWRNPKAMDVERNYNKQASNKDLMKEVDKIKGDRHYFIETQNFEKKNIFRR